MQTFNILAEGAAHEESPLAFVWVEFLLALVVFGPMLWAMIRSTNGFQPPPRRDPEVPMWRLVWASASGVPP